MTNAIFIVSSRRNALGRKKLYFVLTDPEKTFDRVARVVVWWALEYVKSR